MTSDAEILSGRGALRSHTSHWGAFQARVTEDGFEVLPHPEDPCPSPLLGNLASGARHRARIARPMIRRGWLDRGPGADDRRGDDRFVAVPWDDALDRLAAELRRVRDIYGCDHIFGGSYGWASAGRFHHAQSQVHRFLNTLGGYVRSVNSYSAGAAAVILPRVVCSFDDLYLNTVRWPDIARFTDIVVSFGGMATKNTMVAGGGVTTHQVPDFLAEARRRGTKFVLFSPLRDDFEADCDAEWHPIRPGTDTAVMLALAHTLIGQGRHDRGFLERCCVGFPILEAYILGASDGTPKTAAWAAALAGIPEQVILDTAEKLAGARALIAVSQSIQRAEHGEQPVWMGIALAAIVGQIGLPGGGFTYGLGSMADAGLARVGVPLPTMPQGRNPVRSFIPVARISDMLLNPGQSFDYDGGVYTYPDIRLIYWAGGNPFHHHQDLTRLKRAFARPDTIVVHDSAWTASARHADIVLPATMTVERDDIGASRNNARLVAMQRLIAPYGEARDDYAIFEGLAARLDRRDAFTEGRSPAEWLRHLYEQTARAMREQGHDAPDFDTFWAQGELALPTRPFDGGPLGALRRDPDRRPLPTPSGRIELFSETIASFHYADCPGHPTWLPPPEGAGSPRQQRFPLHLIANQPSTRLHSQLDFGAFSQASKRQGREPLRLHEDEAAKRGIADGDIVRVWNDRGAFLACAVLSRDLRPDVAQIATGAWYDPQSAPDDSVLCVHGNPNAVTTDIGTSRLAQGCTGQLSLVEIERYTTRPLPPIRTFEPPVDDKSNAVSTAS